MIYKAYNLDTSKLLTLPETGMGYQVIEARKFGKSLKDKFIVYNAELVIDLDANFFDFRNQIITKGFSETLNKAEMLPVETQSISLLPKSFIQETRYLSESKKSNKKRYSGGKGAKDSHEEKPNGIDVFVRLSPYMDDHRIDFARRRLVEGSFTTTKQDYIDCISYKDDPIDRYALPYKEGETVNWAFFLQPKFTDILQRGIVQPAFGHDGGGIEAFFKNGTSNDTYLGRTPYGES